MGEQKTTNRSWKANLHYFMALILLLHCLFFVIYWIAVGNFRTDVSQYIIDAVGWNLPYIGIMISLSVLVGLWSMIRAFIFRYSAKKGEWKTSTINWIYFGVWLLFLATFYLSFIIILRENPSQWGVLYQLLNLTRIASDVIFFIVAAVWLRKLILFLRQKSIGASRSWPFNISIILSLILLVVLWLVPTIFPPNWAYQGDLPPKPVLLAHRGASMLAPENTLAAAELAADYQAFGFESDLRISWDGVVFLMHDDNLNRTSNISEVFPNRINDRAESFTIDELKQLNAGLWFIQKDPFDTIENGLVSQAQLSINQGQEIPTLAEALDLVRSEDLVFLFDLRYPPEDHPYFETFFDTVFTELQESSLNGDIWFLVDEDKLPIIIEEAPQMTRVIGASSTNLPQAKRLVDQKYEIINIDTGIPSREIRAYRSEGLGVNVYTIDQAWLFSQFWLSGVTSVTTNNVHTFSEMDQPLLNLPYSRYLLIWGLLGIVVAIWLASSQPQREPEAKKPMETPDLLDFAESSEDSLPEVEPMIEEDRDEGGQSESIVGGEGPDDRAELSEMDHERELDSQQVLIGDVEPHLDKNRENIKEEELAESSIEETGEEDLASEDGFDEDPTPPKE